MLRQSVLEDQPRRMEEKGVDGERANVRRRVRRAARRAVVFGGIRLGLDADSNSGGENRPVGVIDPKRKPMRKSSARRGEWGVRWVVDTR